MEDIPGYSPDGMDLIPLLEWLDMLDRGWLSVLCRRAWDPVRGEGVELPEESLEKTLLPTQTDRTRVHSLLITGVRTLENWLEGKEEDEEDSLVHDMRRLGHQSTFDESFHRTFTKLHELGSGEGADDTVFGLGLGFFIAKTLLERSGAKLSLVNQAPPLHGATIKVTWNRTDFERPATAPPFSAS